VAEYERAGRLSVYINEDTARVAEAARAVAEREIVAWLEAQAHEWVNSSVTEAQSDAAYLIADQIAAGAHRQSKGEP
jgi:hypothetical protein